MDVRKLTIDPEQMNRLRELMKDCTSQVDALSEADLSAAERQVSNRIRELSQAIQSKPHNVLAFAKSPKKHWKTSAAAFLAAAAAVLFIQVNHAPDEASILVSKGLDGSVGIGCDVSLVQPGQVDQELDSGRFLVDPALDIYLKFRCVPGSYAHIAIAQPEGLRYQMMNQDLQVVSGRAPVIKITEAAKQHSSMVLIVTQQAIQADELLVQDDRVIWKNGKYPIWSEQIHLQSR